VSSQRFAFSSLFLLTACAAPVLRTGEGPVEPESAGGRPYSASEAPAGLNLPDLKKRIWILSAARPTGVQMELANLPVETLFQKELVETFAEGRSPFVPEQASTDPDLDDEKVARIARGSGISGFFQPRITRFEMRRRADPQGLLQSTTIELWLTVALDLHDAGSAKKVLTVEQSDSIVETRSMIFAPSGEMLPELDRKVAALGRRVAERLLDQAMVVAEKLGWSGRVVRMDGARIYLNSGARTGLRLTDLLKVVEAPREITDPQTGFVIGFAPGRLKATLKVIQLFGADGAVAAIQSGGGVMPGDRVELY
jgi:hypothetical protein